MSQRGQQPPSEGNAAQPIGAKSANPWPSTASLRRTHDVLAKDTGDVATRKPWEEDEAVDDTFGSDIDEMEDRRPPLHRPSDGRSYQPLLHKDDEERGRIGYDVSLEPPSRPPLFTRRSTMRSRSPDTQAKLATRKKYTYAAFFLGLSLVSFVIQTETAVYIQHELGWNKAYCMLYVSYLPDYSMDLTSLGTLHTVRGRCCGLHSS